ncbi:MAG: DUF3606 domain-containing protein [Saprospiraceae bacterium]|nr:DUF3606 domain-containing protein [Saprospiraceae bacterium]
MSDDKSKRGYQDRTRINTKEPYEVDYWTKKWNISSQQLNGAIKATDSTSVKKIEKYLRDNDKI